MQESRSSIPDELAALLPRVRELRAGVVSDGAALFAKLEPSVVRDDFRSSCRNLANYLALRQRDLRPLQAELLRWGLSSLGRCESRVLPTLDALLQSIGLLCGAEPSELPGYPAPEQVFGGSLRIEQQATQLFGAPRGERTARIMVTLPSEAAEDAQLIEDLLRGGVECLRINCAHDDPTRWAAMLALKRRAEVKLGLSEPARVLMDLAGPKVRAVRRERDAERRLSVGEELFLVHAEDAEALTAKRKHSDKAMRKLNWLGCTLAEPLAHLEVGHTVHFDDGKIATRVSALRGAGAILTIERCSSKGVKLRSDKGLNFPDTQFEVPSLTDKDREDLAFVAANADLIGYSFVQSPRDVSLLLTELAKVLPASRPAPGLVLKIETRMAVENLPELLVHAAGQLPTAVMIARGDLAIELGFARNAEIQEELLWLCESANLPVIWATQVLESLSKEGLPTRAEVTDAAMSVRAECVMLNKGPHVLETVRFLSIVLSRMREHQYKKAPQLRRLKSWNHLLDGGSAVLGC